MFFRNLTSVGAEMNNALLTVLSENCFLLIQSLQLSQADLPQRFEDALSATNVAIQEAITSKQTQQNVIIDMETQVNWHKLRLQQSLTMPKVKSTPLLQQTEPKCRPSMMLPKQKLFNTRECTNHSNSRVRRNCWHISK